MHQRAFGNTGVHVSEVGVGTWQFGGDWGEVPDRDAIDTLAAAYGSGVTFFDTADVYGAGRSEQLIGRFLSELPNSDADHVFVATKLGRLHGYPDGYSLELFRRCCQDSCKRLGVDALDLTQLHCIPHEWLQRGEVFDWLGTLRGEGLVKHWGASVESMDEALTCLEHDGLASLQIIFNVFRQKPIHVLFERAKARGVALIVRLPLASGLLAGKFDKDTEFGEDDHRHFNRDGQCFNAGETFAGLPFETGVGLADALKPYTPHGATMAQWAIRWCLDFDAVSVVIPGARNARQACDNAAASDLQPLTKEVHEQLAKFYDDRVAEHIRGAH